MRYLYTDPLAAAWMAKHYGMKFECDVKVTTLDLTDYPPYNKPPTTEYCHKIFLTEDDVLDWRHIQKYYIHPDSVRLLAPIGGDLVSVLQSHVINMFGTYQDNKVLNIFLRSMCGLKVEKISEDAEIRIIQRNCAAFIWPEVENETPA